MKATIIILWTRGKYSATFIWIEKNGSFSFSIHAQSDSKKTVDLNIFRRKPITVGLIDDSKREITPPIMYRLDHV